MARYGSKYADFQVLVRSEMYKRHPVTGDVIEVIPPVTANFGVHGGEFTFTNPETGATDRGARISGHYFDSEQAKEENGWSDDEHDMVIRAIDKKCQEWPAAVWKIAEVKPVAPWPTYDETHHNKIPVLAAELGLVEQALAYEQATKKRDSVVAALTERLPKGEPTEAELTAA